MPRLDYRSGNVPVKAAFSRRNIQRPQRQRQRVERAAPALRPFSGALAQGHQKHAAGRLPQAAAARRAFRRGRLRLSRVVVQPEHSSRLEPVQRQEQQQELLPQGLAGLAVMMAQPAMAVPGLRQEQEEPGAGWPQVLVAAERAAVAV